MFRSLGSLQVNTKENFFHETNDLFKFIIFYVTKLNNINTSVKWLE